LLRPLCAALPKEGAARLRPYLAGIAVALFSLCSAPAQTPDKETVGRHEGGRVVTPVNQIITPAGKQIELPGMRGEALVLSPDGKLLVVSGLTSELLVLDPATGATKQHVQLPKVRKGAPPDSASANLLDYDGHSQISYNGLAFSPDGKRLALSNVNGDVKLFEIAKDGTVKPWRVVALPEAKAPGRDAEIPAGLAFSADGKRLFVCGNLSNRLFEIEVEAGKVRKTHEVGVAPFGVVPVGRNSTFRTGAGGGRAQMT